MKKKHFPIKLVCVCPLENLINTFTSNFQVFLLFLMVKCVYNNCCQQKTVAGMGDLDGVYNLLGDRPDEVDDVCQVDHQKGFRTNSGLIVQDGCMYSRANKAEEKYCFAQGLVEQSSLVECSASLPRLRSSNCCPTKKVSGLGPTFDGTYQIAEQSEEKLEDVCLVSIKSSNQSE